MFAVIALTLLIIVPVRAELRDPNNSADYIILTNQEVLSNNSWINDLLAYREAQGRAVLAVTVEEIWAEFTPSNEVAIRDFLHYAFENWQEPRLKDVFIVGHVDVVPSHLMLGFADSTEYWSENWYVKGDSELDLDPRFNLGRLPWSPSFADPCPDFFVKAQTYEQGSCDPFTADVHLIAGDDEGSYDFTAMCDSVSGRLPENIVIERDYFSRPPGDPAYGDLAELISNLNSGAEFTFYAGYYDGGRWILPDTLDYSVWSNLTNADCLTILGGYSSFAYGFGGIEQTISSAAILNPNGGSIAEIGCSIYCWIVARALFTRDQASACYVEGVTSIGDVWRSTVEAYVSRVISQGTSTYETLLSTVLLGDPATIIPGRGTSADPVTAPHIPSSIQIVGNYPNPFNPSTTIEFLMNRAGMAKLTVFDITGRAVTTLAERNFAVGQHHLTWNAAGLASGIYLVRLESAGQFSTHRVTLLK